MSKLTQKDLQTKVKNNIIGHHLINPGETIILALSGGPDSVCLLELLLELRANLGVVLKACHFNHKMRGGESDNDEKFVQRLCEDKNIELIAEHAAAILSSENDARIARYDFFQKLLDEKLGDKIALAHNANDQAETFLMRIIRGSGTGGLRGILPLRGRFIRPLLEVERREIEVYVQERGLAFVTDKSNADIKYLRNKVRLEILPLLTKVNPNIIQSFNTQAKIAEADFDFIKNQALISLEELTSEEKEEELALDAAKWLNLHPSMQFMTLRLAIERLSSLTDITYVQLLEVVNMIKKGEGNKFKILPSSLIIKLSGGKIRIYK